MDFETSTLTTIAESFPSTIDVQVVAGSVGAAVVTVPLLVTVVGLICWQRRRRDKVGKSDIWESARMSDIALSAPASSRPVSEQLEVFGRAASERDVVIAAPFYAPTQRGAQYMELSLSRETHGQTIAAPLPQALPRPLPLPPSTRVVPPLANAHYLQSAIDFRVPDQAVYSSLRQPLLPIPVARPEVTATGGSSSRHYAVSAADFKLPEQPRSAGYHSLAQAQAGTGSGSLLLPLPVVRALND
jgi:hypothetical protein